MGQNFRLRLPGLAYLCSVMCGTSVGLARLSGNQREWLDQGQSGASVWLLAGLLSFPSCGFCRRLAWAFI